MPVNRPAVPAPPEHIAPLTKTWRKGRRLYRVHLTRYDPLEFNPGEGGSGRFHPINDNRGRPIPTLYAADRIDGALSETVFHNVVAGSVVLRAELATRHITQIELARDITVVDLTGHGLRRLKLQRRQLLECGTRHYSATARWAEAIHTSDDRAAGMFWVSRQYDTAKALLAFGDRIKHSDFTVRGEPRPLDHGSAYRHVQAAASTAGITIVEG